MNSEKESFEFKIFWTGENQKLIIDKNIKVVDSKNQILFVRDLNDIQNQTLNLIDDKLKIEFNPPAPPLEIQSLQALEIDKTLKQMKDSFRRERARSLDAENNQNVSQNKLSRSITIGGDDQIILEQRQKVFIQSISSPTTSRSMVTQAMDKYLEEMEWYYPTMTRQEAEDVLLKCTKDTFLVRPSSQPGCYAVSHYLSDKKEVVHSLIQPSGRGYKWSKETTEYPTVIDLILNCSALKHFHVIPKHNQVNKLERTYSYRRLGSIKKESDGSQENNKQTALHQAIMMNDVNKVRSLLEKATKADLKQRNANNETPLELAITAGKLECLRELLRYYDGTMINQKDRDGNTILHLACMHSTSKTLMLLLQVRGILIQSENARKNTPLHYFCMNQSDPDLQPLEILISKGNVNQRNIAGETPLHWAALNPHNICYSIIRILVLRGRANINLANEKGETSLHYAIRKNRTEVVLFFLRHGADPTKKTFEGLGPHELAAQYGNNELAEELKKAIRKAPIPNKRRSSFIQGIFPNLAEDAKKILKIKKGQSFERKEDNDSVSSPVEQNSALIDLDPTTFSGEFIERNKIINELIQTEKTYLGYLTILQKKCVIPLEKVEGIFHSDIMEVFSNLDEIIECSQTLVDAFSKIVIDNMKLIIISDIFLHAWDNLRAYDSFCTNEVHAMKALERLNQIPSFVQFVETTFSAKEFEQLKLTDYLVKPLQRITKYPLLLTGILKYTPPVVEEHEKLQSITGSMSDLLMKINTHIGNARKFFEIQGLLSTKDLDWLFETRTLLKEATLNRLSSKGKLIEVVLLLVNDYLVVLKRNWLTKHLDPYQLIRLNTLLIEENPVEGYPYAFSILNVSQKKKLIILTNSQVERSSWIDQVHHQMELSSRP